MLRVFGRSQYRSTLRTPHEDADILSYARLFENHRRLISNHRQSRWINYDLAIGPAAVDEEDALSGIRLCFLADLCEHFEHFLGRSVFAELIVRDADG